ncbi:hypothetical protein SAMN05446935_0342 [Burkholderia sp. YR290]|nr:hypothetical protein SAMN05446935_0342 [Burkholderia sp. YR290]
MDGLIILPPHPSGLQVVLHWLVLPAVFVLSTKYVYWRKRRRAAYYRKRPGARPRLYWPQRLWGGVRIGGRLW